MNHCGVLLCTGMLGVGLMGQTVHQPLREQLEERSANQGLGLVCAQNNWMWVHSYDVPVPSIRNPRHLTRAWFSADGSFVALESRRRLVQESCSVSFASCCRRFGRDSNLATSWKHRRSLRNG